SRICERQRDANRHNNRSEDDDEDENSLGKWPHALSSTLACLGCTLGLFNISRFAILSIQFGANFMIQFLILSLILGIPLLTLQVCLGQRLAAGSVDMWSISPICQGVGIALLVAQAFIGIYSIVGVSWMFVFFRDSFITKQDKYRWAEPFLLYREESRFTHNTTALYKLHETVPDYFSGAVLQRHHLIDSNPGVVTLKFQVAFNLAVVWMIVFVSLSKGLRSYGKVVYVFTLVPVFGTLVLCAKLIGLIPPGSFHQLFPSTVWSEFFINGKSWVAASNEVFLTWGLFGAAAMQIAAHNKHKHLLQRDTSLVVILTFVVLLLVAFLANTCVQILRLHGYIYTTSSFERISGYTFMRLANEPAPPGYSTTPERFMSHASFLLGQRVIRPGVDTSAESGYQVLRLATELVPSTLALLGTEQVSPFWAVLFYFILILFGIAQQLAIWHCVITGIMAINTKMMKLWETTITFFSCACGYILGLPMATEVYRAYSLSFQENCYQHFILVRSGILLKRNMSNNVHSVVRRSVPCYFCNEFLEEKYLTEHITHCAAILEECPNKCGVYVPRGNLEVHENMCNKGTSMRNSQIKDIQDSVWKEKVFSILTLLRLAIDQGEKERIRLQDYLSLGIYVVYYLDYTVGGAWWIIFLYLIQIVALFAIRGRPHSGEAVVAELFPPSGRYLKYWVAPLLSFTWTVVLPLTLMALSIIVFKSGDFWELYSYRRTSKDYWVVWARQLGTAIQLTPILIISVVSAIQACRYLNNGPPDIFDRIQLLCRPMDPEDPRDAQTQIGNDTSTSLHGNGILPSATTEIPFEDPPPKYTPPPSYTTATGARIAKMLRQSFRRSVRRIANVLGESSAPRQRPALQPPPPDYATVLVEMNQSIAPMSHDHVAIHVLSEPRPDVTNTGDNRHGVDVSAVERRHRPNTIDRSSKIGIANRSRTIERTHSTIDRGRRSCTNAATNTLSGSNLTAADVANLLRSSIRRGTARTQHSLRRSFCHEAPTTAVSVENLVEAAAPIGEDSLILSKDAPLVPDEQVGGNRRDGDDHDDGNDGEEKKTASEMESSVSVI
ncbi:Sodium- and chloride-dependent glycine transporter 1, partial [Trachymyrmex zeteki]